MGIRDTILIAPKSAEDAGIPPNSNSLNPVDLPQEVIALFSDALEALRRGRSVSIFPENTRLTVGGTAHFLDIPMRDLIKLLDEGEIPYEMLMDQRILALEDVLEYKERRYKRTQELLKEMTALGQEIDPNY